MLNATLDDTDIHGSSSIPSDSILSTTTFFSRSSCKTVDPNPSPHPGVQRDEQRDQESRRRADQAGHARQRLGAQHAPAAVGGGGACGEILMLPTSQSCERLLTSKL